MILGARATMGAMVIALLLAASANVHAKTEGQGDESDRSQTDEPRPRHEIVWTNAEAGIQGLHLRTFEANPDAVTLGVLPADAVGPTLGVGAGVRFVFVTLGVRGRVGMFAADAPGHTGGFQLWTLDAELGIRAPLGRFDPWLTLSGGYATFGGLSTAVSGLQQGLDVNGVNARVAIGFDYYLNKHLSLGASLGGELLYMTRSGISVRDLATPQEVDTLNQAKARLLQANGSSVGAAWSATVGPGVHF